MTYETLARNSPGSNPAALLTFNHRPSIHRKWALGSLPQRGEGCPRTIYSPNQLPKVAGRDSNTVCRRSTPWTSNSVYCYNLKKCNQDTHTSSFPNNEIRDAASALPGKGKTGLQANSGWRLMSEKWILLPTAIFFFPSIEILMDWAGKWEPEKRAGKFCPLLLLLLQLLSNHSECILSLPGLCLRFLGNSPRAGCLQ